MGFPGPSLNVVLDSIIISLQEDDFRAFVQPAPCQPKLDVDVAQRFLSGIIRQAQKDNEQKTKGMRLIWHYKGVSKPKCAAHLVSAQAGC